MDALGVSGDHPEASVPASASGFEIRRTESEEETVALGHAFGMRLRGGELVLLSGPLGAGKTAFVRGMAHGVGTQTLVSSPTFVLEHHYAGSIPILHVDLYRLTEVDPAELAIDDVLAAGGVAVVEWGERLPESYCAGAIRIELAIEEREERAGSPDEPMSARGGRRITFREPSRS